ncbi:hypothetical protein [Compostimonas suwonensis]|uniref:Uncharacterized protein n=1 Tax=Compostimonas suwonensis TaxID=1048394 RepID=A0A2M9BZA7_9MICO|nr:hypothetical protein [Compostimonas suwonensis]PJJ63415.1 hypothetical protein CLV54_1080 [Compostimonas suwonensis]
MSALTIGVRDHDPRAASGRLAVVTLLATRLDDPLPEIVDRRDLELGADTLVRAAEALHELLAQLSTLTVDETVLVLPVTRSTYEEALASVGGDAGLALAAYDPEALPRLSGFTARPLPRRLTGQLAAWGAHVGRPWARAHQEAALAALGAAPVS